VERGAVDFLRPFIINSQLPDSIRHGACLGLAAMAFEEVEEGQELRNELIAVIREENTLVGEAAAIAL
jgi:hypothetical protein